MKIKKYIVKTLSGVDEMVRQDFGPDAVILTIRKLKPKGFASWLFSDRLEVVAAIDERSIAGLQETVFPTKGKSELLYKTDNSSQGETSKIAGTYLDPRFNRKHDFGTATRSVDYNTDVKDHFAENGRLKDTARSLIKTFAFSLAPRKLHSEQIPNTFKADTSHLNIILQSLGLEYPLLDAVAAKLQERFGSQIKSINIDNGDFIDAISQDLVGRIPVAGPILLKKNTQKYVGIIGPSGVGKTTMLLKIAKLYMAQARKHVAILAIEPDNPARVADLKLYAEQVEVPLFIAEDGERIKEFTKQFGNLDLVLVDFPQIISTKATQEWIKCFQEIDIYVALPAGIKNSDAQQWMRKIQGLPILALVVTKTDETAYLSSLPTLCENVALPISYISTGPLVPTDIQVADPNVIAEAIVSRGLLKLVETL